MKKIIFVLSVFAIIFAGGFSPAFSAEQAEKKIVFYAFDVGQGDSLFFELPDGETALIDGGTRDAGATVVKNLHSLGVKKIDLLIATHPHEDHIGGLLDVLNAFPVGKVWDAGYSLGTATQRHFLDGIQRQKIPFSMPKAGYSENIGEVKFEVIAPLRPLKTKNSEANNNSLIVHVSWRDVSFLLMGDAEVEERKTIARFPQSTVLKLSHHGSSDGTNPFLLRNVRPKIAIASCATGNSYGHPHRETVRLLQSHNIPLYLTTGGTVIVESDGKEIRKR